MAELPKVKYTGKIREVRIGKPGCEVELGGETGYSFYSFEGGMPHRPTLALQVLDIVPEEWAAEALEPFKDVLGDPVAWAKKCVTEYKADAVALWLTGTDPNGTADRPGGDLPVVRRDRHGSGGSHLPARLLLRRLRPGVPQGAQAQGSSDGHDPVRRLRDAGDPRGQWSEEPSVLRRVRAGATEATRPGKSPSCLYAAPVRRLRRTDPVYP